MALARLEPESHAERRAEGAAEAFRRGWTTEDLHELTRIDPWFLDQVKRMVEVEQSLSGRGLETLDAEDLADMVVDGEVWVTCEFCNARYRFDPATDLVMDRKRPLPGHANGMEFSAFDAAKRQLQQRMSTLRNEVNKREKLS